MRKVSPYHSNLQSQSGRHWLQKSFVKQNFCFAYVPHLLLLLLFLLQLHVATVAHLLKLGAHHSSATLTWHPPTRYTDQYQYEDSSSSEEYNAWRSSAPDKKLATTGASATGTARRDSELERIEQNLREMHDDDSSEYQSNEIDSTPSSLKVENISPLVDEPISSSASLDEMISMLAFESNELTTYELLAGQQPSTEPSSSEGMQTQTHAPPPLTTAAAATLVEALTGQVMFSPSPPSTSPPLMLTIASDSSPSTSGSPPRQQFDLDPPEVKEEIGNTGSVKSIFGDLSISEEESSSSFASSTALSPFRVMVSPNSVLPQRYKQQEDAPSSSASPEDNSPRPNSVAPEVSSPPSPVPSTSANAGIPDELKRQHLHLQRLARGMTAEEKRAYSIHLAHILKQKAREASELGGSAAPTILFQSLMPLFGHLIHERKAAEQKDVVLPPFHELKKRRYPGSVYIEVINPDGTRQYIVEGENEHKAKVKTPSKRRKRSAFNNALLSQPPNTANYGLPQQWQQQPQLQQQRYSPQPLQMQMMGGVQQSMTPPHNLALQPQQQALPFSQIPRNQQQSRSPAPHFPASNLLKEYLNSPPQYRSPQSTPNLGTPPSPYATFGGMQSPQQQPLSFPQFKFGQQQQQQQQQPLPLQQRSVTPGISPQNNVNNLIRTENNPSYQSYFPQQQQLQQPQRSMSALPSLSNNDALFKAPLPVRDTNARTRTTGTPAPVNNFGGGTITYPRQRYQDSMHAPQRLSQRRGMQPTPLTIGGSYLRSPQPEGPFQVQNNNIPRYAGQIGQSQPLPNQFQFQNAPVQNRLESPNFIQPQPSSRIASPFYSPPLSPFPQVRHQPEATITRPQNVRPLSPNLGSPYQSPYGLSSPRSPFMSPTSPISPVPASSSPILGANSQGQQQNPFFPNMQSPLVNRRPAASSTPATAGVPFRVPPPPYPQQQLQYRSGVEDYNSRMLAGRNRFQGQGPGPERFGPSYEAYPTPPRYRSPGPVAMGGLQQSTNQPNEYDSAELRQYQYQKQLLQQRLQQQQLREQQLQRGYYPHNNGPNPQQQQQLPYRQHQYPAIQQQLSRHQPSATVTRFNPDNRDQTGLFSPERATVPRFNPDNRGQVGLFPPERATTTRFNPDNRGQVGLFSPERATAPRFNPDLNGQAGLFSPEKSTATRFNPDIRGQTGLFSPERAAATRFNPDVNGQARLFSPERPTVTRFHPNDRGQAGLFSPERANVPRFNPDVSRQAGLFSPERPTVPRFSPDVNRQAGLFSSDKAAATRYKPDERGRARLFPSERFHPYSPGFYSGNNNSRGASSQPVRPLVHGKLQEQLQLSGLGQQGEPTYQTERTTPASISIGREQLRQETAAPRQQSGIQPNSAVQYRPTQPTPTFRPNVSNDGLSNDRQKQQQLLPFTGNQGGGTQGRESRPAIAAVIPQQRFGGGERRTDTGSQSQPPKQQQPPIISGGEVSLYNRSRGPVKETQNTTHTSTVTIERANSDSNKARPDSTPERREGGAQGHSGGRTGTSGFTIPILSRPYEKPKFSQSPQQQQDLSKQQQPRPPQLTPDNQQQRQPQQVDQQPSKLTPDNQRQRQSQQVEQRPPKLPPDYEQQRQPQQVDQQPPKLTPEKLQPIQQYHQSSTPPKLVPERPPTQPPPSPQQSQLPQQPPRLYPQQPIQQQQQQQQQQPIIPQPAQQQLPPTGGGGSQSQPKPPSQGGGVGDKPGPSGRVQSDSGSVSGQRERLPTPSDRGNAGAFTDGKSEHSQAWGGRGNGNNLGGSPQSAAPQQNQNQNQQKQTPPPPQQDTSQSRGGNGQPASSKTTQIGQAQIPQQIQQIQQAPQKHVPHHGSGVPFYTQSEVDSYHKRVLANSQISTDKEFENNDTILHWYLQRAKQKLRERQEQNRRHPSQAQASSQGHGQGPDVRGQGGVLAPSVQQGNSGPPRFLVPGAHGPTPPASRGEERKEYSATELPGQGTAPNPGRIPEIPPASPVVQATSVKTTEPSNNPASGFQAIPHQNGLYEVQGTKAPDQGSQKGSPSSPLRGNGAQDGGGGGSQQQHRPHDPNNNRKHEHRSGSPHKHKGPHRGHPHKNKRFSNFSPDISSE